MKLKIGDATSPREPELSLFLRKDGNQVSLIGQHSDIETPTNNNLAWVTEDGQFVINANAISRVGLKLTPYQTR